MKNFSTICVACKKQHLMYVFSMERTEHTQNAPLLLSKRDAAKSLAISVRKIDYLIQLRELPTRRIGRRVLIPRGALLQFARSDHPNRNNSDKQIANERS